MIADDLFAGAGGWDVAAQALGITAYGVENMPEAVATRDAAGLHTIHGDVWTYEPGGERPEGRIASPPCQTFSAAGKGSGRKNLEQVLQLVPLIPQISLDQLRSAASHVGGEERTALVLTPLWFAVHHPTRWMAWEQVPQVLPVWEACADVLRDLGYNVWTGKLYSEQYGVPQTRIRAFLLGSLDREVGRPAPTHSRYYSRSPEKLDEGVAKWVSMAEALGRSPLVPGRIGRPAPTIVTTRRSSGGMLLGRKLPDGEAPESVGGWDWKMVSNYGTGGDARNRGERSSSSPAPTVTSKIDRNRIEFAGAGQTAVDTAGQRRRLEEPAHTLTGKGTAAWCESRPATTVQGDPRLAAPGHRCMTSDCHPDREPESMFAKSVRVTVAEAGVLQSFRADYPWQGNKGQQHLQVGNAVPPLMAMHALAEASGLALPSDLASEENVA